MSDNQEQTNGRNGSAPAENNEVQITEEFIKNLIWRGNDTCIEAVPKDRGVTRSDFRAKKEELFIRFKNECSKAIEYLYSVAKTPELRGIADELCEIIVGALEIARSFLWYRAGLARCSNRFHELAPKWYAAIVAFFSQVGQDTGANQEETRENPQPQQVRAIPIDEAPLKAHAEGEWHDITDSQLRIIKKLNENPGAWVSGKNLKADPVSEERPDKIIKSLNESLYRRIQRSRNGYRLS